MGVECSASFFIHVTDPLQQLAQKPCSHISSANIVVFIHKCEALRPRNYFRYNFRKGVSEYRQVNHSSQQKLSFMSVFVFHQVSHDPTTAGQVIRSDEERASLKAVERHFIAIICLYALAMIIIFIAEAFLQDQEIMYLENILEYFPCLQVCLPSPR